MTVETSNARKELEAPRPQWTQTLTRVVSTHGLLVLFLLLVGLFSLVRPHTFPTEFTFDSVLAEEAVVVLLVLAEMLPVVANQFDLSIGYFLGLCHILVIVA